MLGVGASEAKRRWPRESWEIFLGELFDKMPMITCIVIGDQSDVALGEFLAERFSGRCICVAGTLSLRQTYGLLKRSRLYVGNDSGPMHLASAAKTPCVEISCHPKGGDDSQSNSPNRFGPWKVPAVILQPAHPKDPECTAFCSKSFAHCITLVTPDEVLVGTVRLLSLTPAC